MTTTYDIRTQAFVVLGGVLASCLILWLSLLKTASLQALGTPMFSSDRRFYFSTQLRPDHVLYPLVSGVSRARLRWLSPTEQVKERLQLIEGRGADIDYLMARQDQALVMATLMRNQVELGEAANQVMALGDSTLAFELLSDLKQFEAKLSSVSTQVSPAYHSTIAQLQVENQANQASISTLASGSAQLQ